MTSIPENWPGDFVRRMSAWLGDEASAFFEALSKRDMGLRLNTLRGPIEVLRRHIPWQAEPIPWCPEGVWLQEDAQIGAHIAHTLGLYYSQDPSAMAAAVLLDPQPGEWILDLAAAPGGKTTHLAARMQHEGVLVANEIVRRRASVLAMNVERMGIRNCVITNETPERLGERWPGLFDAVLVDAPCSGEGTFSRDSQAIQDWSIATIEGNARRQIQILTDAATLVRPGGRILYGTCTFAPEENEGVIAAFLEQQTDFELLALPRLPGLSPGRPEWIGAPDILQRTGRFWPHTGPGHGHFYAALRRAEAASPITLPDRWRDTAVPGRVLALYEKGIGEALKEAPPRQGLILTKDDALLITPLPPELSHGLRILRAGWWIGSLRHGKVSPDHALAMALRPEEARTDIDMAPEDPRITTFMRGGFWMDPGPPGPVLITVTGFPLGWAKRGEGRVRSRYPVHLRSR